MSKIIDVHTHIFDDNTYEEYRRKVPQAAEKIITIQYWTGNRQPRHTLGQLIDFAATKHDLRVIAAVNPNFPIESQIVALWERLGTSVVGIKIYPGYEHVYPHDPLIYPVVKLCCDYDKPLVLHSGATSKRGTPLLKYAHPLHVDELATQFPDLKIVIAHLGYPWLRDAAAVVSQHQNVYVDISGVFDQTDQQARRRAMNRYVDDISRELDYCPALVDKILFGTDYSGEHTSLNEVNAYVEVVEKVFEKEDKEKVFYQNAEKVFFA